MYVEFVCPPNSYEVVLGVEMEVVPRVAEKVSIEDKEYRVFSVEWVYPAENDGCSPVVNLVENTEAYDGKLG